MQNLKNALIYLFSTLILTGTIIGTGSYCFYFFQYNLPVERVFIKSVKHKLIPWRKVIFLKEGIVLKDTLKGEFEYNIFLPPTISLRQKQKTITKNHHFRIFQNK